MRVKLLLAGAGLALVGAMGTWSLSQPPGSEAFQNRTRVTVEKSERLPARAVWSSLVAIGDGYLVFGQERERDAPTFALLDARGRVLRVESAADSPCTRPEGLVALEGHIAVAACSSQSDQAWLGVEVEGAELSISRLGTSQHRERSPEARMKSDAFGATHFWLIPHELDSWSVGWAEGMTKPSFSKPGVFGPASSMSVGPGHTLFVAGTLPDGTVVVSHLDQSGRLLKRVMAGTGEKESAQILFDGAQVVLLWTERKPRDGRNILALTHSHLRYRLFDSRLSPRSEVRRLGEDDFVVAPRVWDIERGGVIAWTQGAREPWDSATVLSFDSGEDPIGCQLRRFPTPELPQSLSGDSGNLALLQRAVEATGEPRVQEVQLVGRTRR